MSTENKEIVIEEPAAQPTAPEVPTRAQLAEQGWSASELDSAEKRGMLKAPEPKKAPEASKPSDAGAKGVADPTAKPNEGDPVKPKSGLPDFSMTSDQEKVFLDTFGAGTQPRGLYFRMKSERQARQNAERERDRILLENQVLKDQMAGKEVPAPVIDANGDQVDPEDKPLTLKQLREMQKDEQAKADKQARELQGRSAVVHEALKTQEEHAKSIYGDFDETVGLAKDLMGRIEELLPDPKEKSRLKNMIISLQGAAANADQMGLEDFNAADISYEIGKMHPDYGRKKAANGANADSDGNAQDPNKGNGALTPDQLRRIETNTQRRPSSASLPTGGGRRVIAPEQVTVKELLAMSSAQRTKFRQDHPELYRNILRG